MEPMAVLSQDEWARKVGFSNAGPKRPSEKILIDEQRFDYDYEIQWPDMSNALLKESLFRALSSLHLRAIVILFASKNHTEIKRYIPSQQPFDETEMKGLFYDAYDHSLRNERRYTHAFDDHSHSFYFDLNLVMGDALRSLEQKEPCDIFVASIHFDCAHIHTSIQDSELFLAALYHAALKGGDG